MAAILKGKGVSAILRTALTTSIISASLLASGGGSPPPINAPVLTGNPSISGTAAAGQTLTATHGTYTGTVEGYTGQWFSGATPISGQTGLTYTVTSADAGNTISYDEYAYNSGGNSSVGVSNELGPVPVPGATPITYDTSIGAGVDSEGFTDLPLRAGAKRLFVNPAIGSDTNTSTQAQDPSTPLATFTKAISYLTNGAGDQILIAEGSSFANGFTVWGTSGYSPMYPVVIQTYDPADPTNEAKYGRATGSKRPVINTGGTVSQPFIQGSSSPKYFAMRGLDFNPGQVQLAELKLDGPSSGTPDYFLFENIIFRYTGLTVDMSTLASGLTARKFIVRNCSLYEEYGDHSQGVYISNIDGATIEDSVFWANGRLASASRSVDQSVGGASKFNHPIYAQSNTSNTVVRRNVFIDTATDGGNLKGGGLYQGNLIIRVGNAFALGSGNSYSEDKPFGVYMDASFNTAIGSNIVSTLANYSGAIGWGAHTNNGKPVSRIHHNVLARNDQSTGYAWMADSASDVTYNIAQPNYTDFDYNVSYLWNPSGQSAQFTGGANTHATVSNTIWDDPTSGTNTNVGSATFPNAYTETSLLAELGYADETSFINDVINYPEKHVQRKAVSLMLAGYGVSIPTPQTITTDMTLTLGVASSGMFIGTLDGSTLSSSNLPTGVELDSDGRSWRYDGSGIEGSGTFDITENNGSNSHTSTISWSKHARPALSGLSVTKASSTTGTINLSTTDGSGTLYWMATTDAVVPDWPQIRGGVNGSNVNSPATSFGVAHGSQAVSASGAQAIAISGVPDSFTGNLYIAQVGANENASVTYTTTINLSSGPYLTSPTGTSTGTTTATIGVTTDTPSGTLDWVVSTSATKPTAAQIKAGQDSTGAAAAKAGSQAVTATGVQSADITGLTNGTAYYAHFVHTSGADSNIVSSGAFTPSLPLTATLVDNFDDNSMDATKWTIGQISSPTSSPTGVVVTEANGQVHVTGPGNATSAFAGYLSVNPLKLEGSSFFLRIPNVASYGSNDSLSIVYGTDANNNYLINFSATVVQLYKRVAGTKTILASAGFGSNVWFRVRAGSGRIYVDGAPATANNPPLEAEWVNITSSGQDGSLSTSNGYINFGAGSWRAGAVTTFQFDGFNTASN